MESEFWKSVNKNKPWVKCMFAVNVHTRHSLLEVLHDPLRGGIPLDPQELYDFFQDKDQQDKIKDLQKRRILNANQIDLLLPQNQRTFSLKWDVTLICVIIINFSKLPPPTNGWFKPLDAGDISVSAFVVVAREERNRLNHAKADIFNDEKNFRPFWSKVTDVLKTFQYTKLDDFNNLETENVDLTTFESYIDGFIEFSGEKDKQLIIPKAIKWLRDYNEKSKL